MKHLRYRGTVRFIREYFGIASEDCNCRCCLLQRAKWALSEEEYYTKWNGNKNELVRIKAKNYDNFKEQTRIHLSKTRFPDDIFKIRGITDEIKDELGTALLKLKSEYDIKLNSILVEKRERMTSLLQANMMVLLIW